MSQHINPTPKQTDIALLDSNLNQFTSVPTNTYNGDLNSLLTPGWYLLGSSVTNTPSSLSAGKLKVEHGGTDNYVRQTYYGGFQYFIYTRIRYYANNIWQWTSWQEVTNSVLSYTTAALQTSNGTLESWSRVDKSGNTVVVTLKMTMTTAVNAWNEIATVPSGFRPHTSLNFNVVVQNGSTLMFDQLQILDTGAIRLASNLASGTVFGFTVSYVQ